MKVFLHKGKNVDPKNWFNNSGLVELITLVFGLNWDNLILWQKILML